MSPEIAIRPAERHDTAALGRLINAIQRQAAGRRQELQDRLDALHVLLDRPVPDSDSPPP